MADVLTNNYDLEERQHNIAFYPY